MPEDLARTPIEERRRYPRRPVSDVSGSFLLAADATIVNMSLTGLALETPTYLHVGRDYQIKVQLTGATLDLTGTIVWCTLVKTQKGDAGEVVPIYRAGVRFAETLTEIGDELATLLRESTDARLAERITGRIRMPGREDSSLEVIVPFSVVELSESGMRISTQVRLEPDAEHSLELRFGANPFSADARVVHCEGDPLSGEPLVAGVEFLRLDDSARQTLQQLISDQVIEL